MNSSTAHDWLDQLPLNDPAWLQLLVDDELTWRQRQDYVAYLEENPERWRQCAAAFLDEQVLRRGLRDEGGTTTVSPVSAARRTEPTARRRFAHPNWPITIAIAICLLLGLAIGRWTATDTAPGARLSAPAASGNGDASPAPAKSTLPQTPARAMALYQLSDDWRQAEFEVEGVAPRFLMDVLLFAGHSISLEQRLNDEDTLVNVMQIQKFGQLLAEQP